MNKFLTTIMTPISLGMCLHNSFLFSSKPLRRSLLELNFQIRALQVATELNRSLDCRLDVISLFMYLVLIELIRHNNNYH